MRSLVFSIFTLLICLNDGGYTQTTPPPPSIVAATVNGETITLAELDGALAANLPVIPLTVAQRKQLRAALLSDLIDDRLLKQFLAKYGPKVEPSEVEAQLKAFTAQLSKDHQTLNEYLKKSGLTETQLRADWTASIQLSTLVQQQATDAQLKAYYAANRDYFDKVEVRVSHIIIRMSNGAPPGERAGVREKMKAIRADVASGKMDFAAAARRFSQDPTGKNGGDLGFVLRRCQELEEPLAKTAFAMKVGEISDLVETNSGIHLLVVTDRKPGKPGSFEKSILEVLELFTEDYRVELVAKLRKDGQIRISLP
jgi:parvulin-like peptidyl-prolyl isomerase